MNVHSFYNSEFETFQRRIDHWMKELGLTEWRYEVRQEQIGERVSAQVQYNSISKQALFRLSCSVEYDFGIVTDIDALALHEVLHLMLADFGWACANVGISGEHSDLATSHEHELLHRLMNVLLKDKA